MESILEACNAPLFDFRSQPAIETSDPVCMECLVLSLRRKENRVPLLLLSGMILPFEKNLYFCQLQCKEAKRSRESTSRPPKTPRGHPDSVNDLLRDALLMLDQHNPTVTNIPRSLGALRWAVDSLICQTTFCKSNVCIDLCLFYAASDCVSHKNLLALSDESVVIQNKDFVTVTVTCTSATTSSIRLPFFWRRHCRVLVQKNSDLSLSFGFAVRNCRHFFNA